MDYFKRQTVNDWTVFNLGLRQNKYNFRRWWREYYHGSHHRCAKLIKRKARRIDKMQLKNELFWNEMY